MIKCWTLPAIPFELTMEALKCAYPHKLTSHREILNFLFCDPTSPFKWINGGLVLPQIRDRNGIIDDFYLAVNAITNNRSIEFARFLRIKTEAQLKKQIGYLYQREADFHDFVYHHMHPTLKQFSGFIPIDEKSNIYNLPPKIRADWVLPLKETIELMNSILPTYINTELGINNPHNVKRITLLKSRLMEVKQI